jgi:glycosyltransferase involved in cell wall biosynthesis
VKIGVVTPVYNVAAYIGDTIASLLAQSHADWAMFVVDDGSTDATAEVLEGIADRRIRLLSQANAGVAAARNRGIAELDGRADAVLFLDGDDVLAPDALARLVGALEAEPSAVAAYGAYAFVTEDGARVTEIRSGPFPAGDILERLLEQNLFANGGHLLIRRAAVAAAGGFRAGIAYGEDWEYWTRIALAGPFAVVPGATPLLLVRQRAGGAYLRMASDPRVFAPCMQAVFGNPAMAERFGAVRLGRIRRRTEAENAWIVGRELVRHGRNAEGLAPLRRSFAGKPGLKRLVLLAVAHLLAVTPANLHGPFRRYEDPVSR